MPFGLTNASASYQQLINDILYEYLDIFIVAYLDDILVFSKIKKEHMQHVKKVLQKLRNASLLFKLEKYKFHKERVFFLGFIMGCNSISMDQTKIEAVLSWLRLTSVKEVQIFLGFANFYQCFIKGYSVIAHTLMESIKKDQPF
jgi:Reverse transcriptase (RNA-dependent DNA polymerase)